jgi:glucosamine--fructose-6-phosphate aminotransferase (isomerizing)
VLAGIGTSHHAAQLGAFFLRAAGRDAWAVQSADLATYPFPLAADDAVVVISHRGTKRYSLLALERARALGAWTLGITGQSSPLAGVDQTLYTVEQEGSSTHSASYTGALLVLALLATRLGAGGLLPALQALPDQLEALLIQEARLRDWVQASDPRPRFVFSGGGLNGWTALEGALKAKEAAYVTAEGMALETLLHGPVVGLNRDDHLALVNPEGPFERRAAEIGQAALEIGLRVLWLGRQPASLESEPGLAFPAVPELLSPFLATPPLQLLAAFLAERCGTNPDSFRLDVADYDRALKPIQL